MAFAPLDAWARLLFAPFAPIPLRYWPRVAFGLFTSALGTTLTLPERLILAPLLAARARRTGATLSHAPGALVILGYFRSGTTHLHYLLSCDPQFRTPRWCETLAPQGFLLSWSFLRIFMIPFVSSKRPQDDVAIGPDWPAEDDFALNNWSLASSLPGRFILPREHAHYDRFHSLEGLSAREHNRWRRTQWAFCWKLARLAPRRALLLKTPSHTARARELDSLFGGNVKFLHISRDPGAVLRSNLTMAHRLSGYNLQDPPQSDDLEGRLAREYADSEQRFLDQSASLRPGQLATMRYEDLIADPLGELRRVYSELGLGWTPDFERRVTGYLVSVRDYRAATPPSSKNSGAQSPLPTPFATLATTFGHDRPAKAAVPLPPFAAGDHSTNPGRGMALGTLAMMVCIALWLTQSWFLYNRRDTLVWPTGVVIGLATLRGARVGSTRLGLWAAALTVFAFLAISIPATCLSDYLHRTSPPYHIGYEHRAMRDWEWYHILKASRVGTLAWNNLFYVFMGAVTAYRFASRRYTHPPGRG
jgi:hypothetical protein